MRPLEVFLVGGSHLGSAGLPPTASFATLVSRRLRHRLGASFQGTQSVFYEGDPAGVAELLPGRLSAAAVVVLPRNLALVPMLGELRGAAARLRGGRSVEFRSVFVPRESPAAELLRRLRRLARQLAAGGYAALGLGLLPLRLARYGRHLDTAIGQLRAGGCGLVVLATPIPLAGRHFPMARLHQRRYAQVIRRRRAPGVAIADLFAALMVERHGFLQPRDPLHLTPEGHRRVAAVLADVIEVACTGGGIAWPPHLPSAG